MSRPHRPPQPRPSAASPSPPRTALGVVPLALTPPAVVLLVDRPLVAALSVAAVVAVAAALLLVRRLATAAAPSTVTVRVPVVELRVEIGLARTEGRAG
ncbi:MAG: hypothetical protein ABEH47_00115 [Haloferacaceae archaeon]